MEQAEEQQVIAANETFCRAFAGRDSAAMEAIWVQKRDVICIHPGWNVLNGRDEVMASWDAILRNPAQPRVVAGGVEIHVHGEVGVVICRLFALEDGEWRIFHHHSSPVMPQ